MAVEASLSALQGVSALPALHLAVLGALAFVVLAFAGRVVYRNLPSSQPPILEGIPYIGGLLKFASVRASRGGLRGATAAGVAGPRPPQTRRRRAAGQWPRALRSRPPGAHTSLPPGTCRARAAPCAPPPHPSPAHQTARPRPRHPRPPKPRARAQGPWRLMEQGYSQLGEVFTVPVAHKRVTFLIGPDVAPHFFKATDDEMSQTEVRRRARGQRGR